MNIYHSKRNSNCSENRISIKNLFTCVPLFCLYVKQKQKYALELLDCVFRMMHLQYVYKVQ